MQADEALTNRQFHSTKWILLATILLILAGTAWAGNSHYPDNASPLKEKPFTALPLGSVRANGWLRLQLELQRDGLTGHAEEALTELDESSAWRGGDKDNWERSPYYLKGLIPLAYTLDDAGLKQRAQKWVDWVLSSQREDGFYGPKQNDDWWPRMVSNYFLRDYYEATGDARVLPFLGKYYRHMLGALPKRPLRDWGKSRAGDDMDTAIWLYNRTREPFLLELVDLLRKQAYDWPAIMHGNLYQNFGTDFQPKHNVNVPQALKMPAVSWQRTGDARERTAIDAGDEHLMREHGLSVGMQSGTEFLAGRSSGQGIEFCSIVEQMLSDGTIARIFGDAKFSDRLEQIAYNALPAAWNRDLTALRYYSLPNHVIAKRGSQGFGQNYDNGIVYGPRSGYPCCCFNVHQGWPKFVQNSWAATEDDGLAPMAYAPNTVTAKVGKRGVLATITQETSYPFSDKVRFKFTLSEPAEFPLVLRTPGWCEDARITVNGRSVRAAKPGAFGKITREWKTGDELVMTLPMPVRVQRGVHNSASVHRGPLAFSLHIPAETRVVGQPARGFNEFEVLPVAPWNYALALDTRNPQRTVRVVVDETALNRPGVNPFTPSNAPVKLVVTGRRLPGWELAWNGVVAFDPPFSPVASSEPEERLTLLPFGAQDLRLTDFPVLGRPAVRAARQVRFAFEDNTTTGWTWHGGGWWAHDGKLRTTPTGGAPGFRALIEETVYSDLRIEAEVTPPPRGDAGLVFRVTKPGIGPDAYQGYYAGFSANDKSLVLGRADGRSWNPLKSVPSPVEAGTNQPIVLSVSAIGNRLELRVNGRTDPVISVTDDTWKAGQAGVRMYSTDSDHAFSAFDNVRVTPLRSRKQ